MGLSNSKSLLTILTTSSKLDKNWTVKRVNYIEKIVKAIETYSGEKVSYIDMFMSKSKKQVSDWVH